MEKGLDAMTDIQPSRTAQVRTMQSPKWYLAAVTGAGTDWEQKVYAVTNRNVFEALELAISHAKKFNYNWSASCGYLEEKISVLEERVEMLGKQLAKQKPPTTEKPKFPPGRMINEGEVRRSKVESKSTPPPPPIGQKPKGGVTDRYIDIVFIGPPEVDNGLVECEDETGASIKFGEWLKRKDGYWVLRIPRPSSLAWPTAKEDLAARSGPTPELTMEEVCNCVDPALEVRGANWSKPERVICRDCGKKYVNKDD